jgi:hypothetical protein
LHSVIEVVLVAGEVVVPPVAGTVATVPALDPVLAVLCMWWLESRWK